MTLVNARRVPSALQEPLLSGVADLAEQAPLCVPPAPAATQHTPLPAPPAPTHPKKHPKQHPKHHGKKKGKHK